MSQIPSIVKANLTTRYLLSGLKASKQPLKDELNKTKKANRPLVQVRLILDSNRYLAPSYRFRMVRSYILGTRLTH